MRKILFGLSLIFLSATANAGTFTPAYISNDSSATPAIIDSNFKGFADAFNGNVEGSSNGTSVLNVKADSIYEINMADDANRRISESELLNITTDTVSGGTLTQGAVAESGLTPADSANLTSDISAGTAYVNGYRVTKSATSQTYTASRDTYVDLSQTGTYTLSPVTNGAAQPAVAANSIRLAKVVTDGTEITSVTTLYTTRVPGLIIPSNYRDGLYVSRDSATTITVFPGSAEINNSIVSKTATTTLTLTTAGDWAGGSSLRAANTYGYVGLDTSGNLKMHTTAPTHDNYGVSTTAGKKRYATWSSTVYRALGWFYMDGSQNLADANQVSNIKEGNVSNSIMSNEGSKNLSISAQTTSAVAECRFYSSGNPVMLNSVVSMDLTTAVDIMTVTSSLMVDGATISGSEKGQSHSNPTAGTNKAFLVDNMFIHTPSQGTHTYRVNIRNNDGTAATTYQAQTLNICEQ